MWLIEPSIQERNTSPLLDEEVLVEIERTSSTVSLWISINVGMTRAASWKRLYATLKII
ncbi:MAG: hypothetical protein U0905_17550 [Pirellulales bacterium]